MITRVCKKAEAARRQEARETSPQRGYCVRQCRTDLAENYLYNDLYNPTDEFVKCGNAIIKNLGEKQDLETEEPKDYKAEGDEFIRNLKSSADYCQQFFFDTEMTDKKGKRKTKTCQIAPLRSKMVYDLQKEYGVTVNPDDFSTVVYLALWAEGTWSPLVSFQGRCSFFAWLRKVARNVVVEWLTEEGLINDVPSRTTGNTRLTLLSRSPTECKMVIDDLMTGSKYYELLTAIYVDRLTKNEIMSRMHTSGEEYESAKKTGEKKLKDALLRSVEVNEEEVLRNKANRVVTVSSDFVTDMAEWCKTKAGANLLSDVFGTDLSDEEVRVRAKAFLYDFSAKMAWNEQDCYIWRRRFIENVAPTDVALEVNRDRAWLDTRYSQLNRKFKKAIKRWWKANAA